MCHWRDFLIRPMCTLLKGVYFEPDEMPAHKAIFEGFEAVVRSKNASPTWNDVKTALLDFDRAGLRGLVQDLYTASKDNQAFLHARFGLGRDPLQPFKAGISRWISPNLMKGQHRRTEDIYSWFTHFLQRQRQSDNRPRYPRRRVAALIWKLMEATHAASRTTN